MKTRCCSSTRWRQRSYLWLVSQRSIDSYEPSRAELEAAARLAYELLSAPETLDSARSAIHRPGQTPAGCCSARWLELSGNRLVVVAPGALFLSALPRCRRRKMRSGWPEVMSP